MTWEVPKGRITRVFWTDCNRKLITSHDYGILRRWDVEVSSGRGRGGVGRVVLRARKWRGSGGEGWDGKSEGNPVLRRMPRTPQVCCLVPFRRSRSPSMVPRGQVLQCIARLHSSFTKPCRSGDSACVAAAAAFGLTCSSAYVWEPRLRQQQPWWASSSNVILLLPPQPRSASRRRILPAAATAGASACGLTKRGAYGRAAAPAAVGQAGPRGGLADACFRWARGGGWAGFGR